MELVQPGGIETTKEEERSGSDPEDSTVESNESSSLEEVEMPIGKREVGSLFRQKLKEAETNSTECRHSYRNPTSVGKV